MHKSDKLARWSESTAPSGQSRRRSNGEVADVGAVYTQQHLPPTSDRYGLALFSFASERYDAAIELLRAVDGDHVPEAVIANDTAACWIEKGLATGNALHFARALEELGPYAGLDQGDPDLGYNWGLSLGLLGLQERSVDFLRHYQSLSDGADGGWQALSRHLVNRFSSLPSPSRFEEDRVQLETAALESGDLGEWVFRYPDLLRDRGFHQYLAAWATDVSTKRDGSAGARPLRIAFAIGQALHSNDFDSSLVEASEILLGMAPEAALGAASGYLNYIEGYEAYLEKNDFSRSDELFGGAAEVFETRVPALAMQARFHWLIGSFFAAPLKSYSDFEEFLAEVDADRYPWLAGRTSWLLGTLDGRKKNYDRALRHYEAARDYLYRASGPGGSAFIHTLMAEVYELRGDLDLAWQERSRAMELVPRRGEKRRIMVTLSEAARALKQEGLDRAASLLADEVALMADGAEPEAIATSRLHRARLLLASGDVPAALLDVAEAREFLSRADWDDFHQRTSSELDLLEAEALATRDPAKSIRISTLALRSLDRVRYDEFHATALSARATAYQHLGDLDSARADLMRAVSLQTTARDNTIDALARARLQSRVRVTLNRLVALLFELGDVPSSEILELIDSNRSVAIDQSEPMGFESADLSWIPDDTSILVYFKLPEAIHAWKLSKRSVESIGLMASPPVHSFSMAGTEALGSRLLPPVSPQESLLVVVPDAELASLPWPYLENPATGRLLIQDMTVTMAPSVRWLRKAMTSTTVSSESVLSVEYGDPPPDTAWGPLPFTAPESSSVSEALGSFPTVRLAGAKATPEAVLRAATEVGFIHFAGHALTHSSAPELSALLLAPDSTHADGRLRLKELLAIELSGNPFAVLSACSTMLEPRLGGEAFFSLAGAFLRSGASGVLSSSRPVRGQGLPEAMGSFAAYVAKGQPPAAAYRNVALDLVARSDTRALNSWKQLTPIGGLRGMRSPTLKEQR